MVSGFWLRLYTDEYYMALGRFVVDFTELEGAMQVALWHLSKVKTPVAQAVFSGVRADDACNKITRLSDAERWSKERRAEWKTIADRLGILRALRNDILHYGAEWQLDGTWIVTNRSFAHTPERVTTTPISLAILEDASADLQKLSLHLFRFLFGDEMTPSSLSDLDSRLRTAWHYKSSRQAGHADKSLHAAPKQIRQPGRHKNPKADDK